MLVALRSSTAPVPLGPELVLLSHAEVSVRPQLVPTACADVDDCDPPVAMAARAAPLYVDERSQYYDAAGCSWPPRNR
eukprot:13733764-Alexandrium_andersonii.AAC.1